MTRRQPAPGPPSILADLPSDLAPLDRAVAVARRAAEHGFDWERSDDVLPVIRSEVEELAEALADGRAGPIEAEFGDLLFALTNLARHIGVDPA